MSDKFTVRILKPVEYEEWNALVTASPQGSIYARPEYLDTLCSVTGGFFEIHGVFRKGVLIGGLPLYWQTGRAGKIVMNRLLLYYNGLVMAPSESRSPSKQQSLLIGAQTALSQHLKLFELDSVTIHCRLLDDSRVFRSDGWHVRPHYTLTVQLDDIESCWQRIDHNLRRLVRRSESKGVAIRKDGDFEEFYRQHQDLCNKKGLPAYLTQDRFKQYFQQLSKLGLCELFHARLKDGNSIAGLLVLTDEHPTTHTVMATSSEEFHDVGASAHIRWEAFKYLSERGYKANDLTDASLNSVTRFKSQLGGQLQQNLVLSLDPSRRYRFFQKIASLRGGSSGS